MRIVPGGNVGIGTTSPSNAKLVVNGSGASGAIMSIDPDSTTSFVRILGDISNQNLLNWQSGTDLRFATSTQTYSSFSERMRITSAGNVGIGTTSPGAMLEISKNQNGTGLTITQENPGNGYHSKITFRGSDGSGGFIQTAGISAYQQTNGR